MIKGLYTSALGMTTQMSKMDVVSNNIANAGTTGFKKDTVVTRAFTEELMERLNDKTDVENSKRIGNVSQGVFIDDVYTNFKSGSLQQTNGTLDLAITGNGFFTVTTLNRDNSETTRYTRDGSFTLDANGVLRTKDGHAVMGENGQITITGTNVVVTDDGSIYSNGTLIDRFAIVDFTDTHSLRKYGSNLYNTTPESVVGPFTGTVSQGFLESSNVNSVNEMVDMITVSRTYEANQRLITIHDMILGKVVNEIGRK